MFYFFFLQDGNICEYDIIKSESLVDACTESCIKGNLSLCEILIQTHELLTPKLGEKGKGLPPLSLSDTKKVNETVSKAEEPQNLLEVPQEGMFCTISCMKTFFFIFLI